MEDILKVVGAVVVALIVAALSSFITGAIIMWLWNAIMPDIFALTTITYWQGVGMALLSSCLFARSYSNSKSN